MYWGSRDSGSGGLLIRHVGGRVERERGVTLELEVKFVGRA
jgi:hypothetical protein